MHFLYQYEKCQSGPYFTFTPQPFLGGEWVLLPQRLVQDPADDGGEEEEGAGAVINFDKGDDDHEFDKRLQEDGFWPKSQLAGSFGVDLELLFDEL